MTGSLVRAGGLIGIRGISPAMSADDVQSHPWLEAAAAYGSANRLAAQTILGAAGAAVPVGGGDRTKDTPALDHKDLVFKEADAIGHPVSFEGMKTEYGAYFNSYIHRAVWAADNRELHWDPTYGSLPKVFASQAAWKIVTRCSEIHGGSGFMRDIGFEKLIRDAAAFLHSDGVNRTLLLKAARHMF